MADKQKERRAARKGQVQESVGPDPAHTAEENLVAALDFVTQRLLEDHLMLEVLAQDELPWKSEQKRELLPKAALEALCELHPQFQEKAKYRRIQADKTRLEKKVADAEDRAKKATLRRKKKSEEPAEVKGGPGIDADAPGGDD